MYGFLLPKYDKGREVMAIPSSLVRDLLVHTGFFEGHDGFSTVTGNFDRQGLSFGILQFNFGQETLQPVLKDYIKYHESEFTSIFGKEKAAILKKVVFEYRKEDQVRWGTSISLRGGGVLQDWKIPFQEMGRSRNNQKYQEDAGMQYVDRAEDYCKRFGIVTTQGLAFMFDHMVQTYRFVDERSIFVKIRELEDEYRKSHDRERLPDQDRLSVILDYISESANQKLRRGLIKDGYGNYLGKGYDISDFGYGSLSYYSYF
ncbi:hypothetical protein ABD72_02865 [Brevibacillus laterosporus]|nr:hypothetical protein BrL25_21000 [Brevibacillus laterosporus DSM 25]MBG9799737.1 hypothetical protein [Brevibacillus laterosporus]MBG9801173.1 hypothetical protein [Brevibacillus laterosporus]